MDNQNSQRPVTKWLFLVSHPVASFSVGIVGIILAVYFYLDGITKPNIIFLIHPIRTSIVQAGKFSDLSVSLHGKPINSDVTVAQFMIWNSGKAPVRHDDILKPILLMTASNCPIYEATIRNVSRGVIDFQLITNEIASGRLSFDWRILEHNDGASIQILYGGDQNLTFYEEQGIMVGQSRVPFELLNVDTQDTKRAVGLGVIFLLLSLGCANKARILSRELIKSMRGGHSKQIPMKICGAVFSSGITLFFVFLIWQLFSTKNAPPFAF